ncbi:MAG: hypothetical protein AAGG01_06415 [Planctomycetota bacterium]
MLAHCPFAQKASAFVSSLVLLGASAAVAGPQGPLSQDVYIKSASPEFADLFGHDVVAYGDRIAFSAPQEDSAATGVGGSPFNNGASDSGAVYIYRFVGGAWVQEAYIKAANAGTGDAFGASIALGPNLLVVGAPGESSSSPI